MWRIWSYIPRAIRQQFHGPRASAGVYVEEEKVEYEVEKREHEKLTVTKCVKSSSDERHRDETHHEDSGCHHRDFWSQFCGPQRTLEAVKWGTAVVLGLQLFRHPTLRNYFDLLKDPEKLEQWRDFLTNVAFALPPNNVLAASRSIVRQNDASKAKTQETENSRKQKEGSTHAQSANVSKDQSLDDIMHEFDATCRNYTAVSSTVSGLCAADKGRMDAAVEQLSLACGLGHAPACYNLAVLYETGRGVKKNAMQAASYYGKAAGTGHAQAIFNLALMTLKGEGGVAKDKVKAIRLFNRAAKRGLAQAQIYLGVYYTENDDDQLDFERAVSFFKDAACQKDAEGQYFLGICYENGWGLESSDEEAARLYSEAARLGHDGAMYNLAAFHEYGLGGVRQDMEEAMSLYRQSAQCGNESAKSRLQEEEARKAVQQWSANSNLFNVIQRPGFHSSSPSLTDFSRQNSGSLWRDTPGTWSSSQSLSTLSRMESFTSDEQTMAVEPMNCSYRFMNGPHSCVSGMSRTSTMPELNAVLCL